MLSVQQLKCDGRETLLSPFIVAATRRFNESELRLETPRSWCGIHIPDLVLSLGGKLRRKQQAVCIIASVVIE